VKRRSASFERCAVESLVALVVAGGEQLSDLEILLQESDLGLSDPQPESGQGVLVPLSPIMRGARR